MVSDNETIYMLLAIELGLKNIIYWDNSKGFSSNFASYNKQN